MHRDRGRVAEHLGLCRPSYEQTRVVVHALRAGRRSSGIGEALLDVAFRVRPPDAVLDVLAGTR